MYISLQEFLLLYLWTVRKSYKLGDHKHSTTQKCLCYFCTGLMNTQTHLLITFRYQCITKCINILLGQLTFLVHTQFNLAAPGCRPCRVAGSDLDKVSTHTHTLDDS